MSKSIVKACVKYNDRLYTGFDHGECFKKLNEDNTIIVHSEIEQGFVDSDGNFVDRKQAMIIAKEAGQLRYEPSKKTLISEDLHLDWLNQQDQLIAELEEQLKNAIVPKFKIGQEVWSIFESQYFRDYKELCNLEITAVMKTSKGIFYQGYVLEKGKNRSDYWFNEEKTFLTKEKAQAKLQELQGESDVKD